MPDNKLKRSSDWRCRREEYLRASGRREDLICEGYESPGPVAKLVVIPGGGNGRQTRVSSTGQFIVDRELIMSSDTRNGRREKRDSGSSRRGQMCRQPRRRQKRVQERD